MALHTIPCDSCGRHFDASRPDAETCSDMCRQRRHRERKAAAGVRAAALLHAQTSLIIRMTSTEDDIERSRLLRELDELARHAERTLPAAA